VAYHGSAYRTLPTGYKVVYSPVHGTRAGPPQDLITGWLTSSTSYSFWGRPVGVLVAADGSHLVSDDDAGVIYRPAPLER
jgi:glucose/arabinose dehydrogenase